MENTGEKVMNADMENQEDEFAYML